MNHTEKERLLELREEVLRVLKSWYPKDMNPSAVFTHTRIPCSQPEVIGVLNLLCKNGEARLIEGDRPHYKYVPTEADKSQDDEAQEEEPENDSGRMAEVALAEPKTVHFNDEKPLYMQVLDYILEKGPISSPYIREKFGASTPVFLRQLVKKGLIECTGTTGINTKLWGPKNNNSEPAEPANVEELGEDEIHLQAGGHVDVISDIDHSAGASDDLVPEDLFNISTNSDRVVAILDAIKAKSEKCEQSPHEWWDELRRRMDIDN